MRQQVKTVTFFTDNTTHQLSKNQCSTSKNKMLKLSTWINALPGLTHHFSNFAAKMMPTKPYTLEHRRHGYRAMRSVAGAPIGPNPKPSLLTTPPKTIAHLDSEPRQGPDGSCQSGNCQSGSEWHHTLAFAILATAGNCHWGPEWLPHGYLLLFTFYTKMRWLDGSRVVPGVIPAPLLLWW